MQSSYPMMNYGSMGGVYGNMSGGIMTSSYGGLGTNPYSLFGSGSTSTAAQSELASLMNRSNCNTVRLLATEQVTGLIKY